METTRERVIKRSLKQIDRRLKKIESLISANPIKEIIALRKEASKLMESYINVPPITKLKELAEKEKYWLNFHNTYDVVKLVEEKSLLLFEQGQLNFELARVKRELV